MDNYNSSQNVNEHRIWNENNVLFAIFSWFFIALIEFIAVFILKLNSEYSIILAFFLILFYTVLLFFLLEPEILREVNTRETRTIEKPIFKEVIKEILNELNLSQDKYNPNAVASQISEAKNQMLTPTLYSEFVNGEWQEKIFKIWIDNN